MQLDKSKLWVVMTGLIALTLTLWGSGAIADSGSSVVADNAATGNVPRFSNTSNPPRAPIPVAARPEVVMRAGTPLRIRLDNAVSTRVSRPGDHFNGTLVSPIAVDNVVILPVGTTVGGHVVSSAPSGRLKGQAVLSLRLDSVSLTGKTFRLSTASDTRVSRRHKKHNLLWIGGGSGGGVLIGALAGGPVGAAIGAGSGAVAGVAGAMITGRRQVNLPAETELTFHLSRSLAVPEHPLSS